MGALAFLFASLAAFATAATARAASFSLRFFDWIVAGRFKMSAGAVGKQIVQAVSPAAVTISISGSALYAVNHSKLVVAKQVEQLVLE